jgi:thymidylate synthase (FAD)
LVLKQKASCDLAFHTYEELIKKGVSRELARTHLPQSTFTEFYWKINLHNLLHFLELRIDDHAQKEIRDLAKQVYDLIKPMCPMTCEAFEDFRLGSITLSRLEIEALKSGKSDIQGKGENQEFKEKISRIMNEGEDSSSTA